MISFLRSLVPGLAVFTVAMYSTMAAPVAWWRFEGDFGSSVGDGLILVPGPGDALSDETPGERKENRSSYCPGSDKGAELANNDVLEQCINGGSFTIEAFVKTLRENEGTEPGKEFYRIIGNANNQAPGGWALMIHNRRLRFFAYAASTGEIVDISSNDEVDSESWHHVAVVGLRDGEYLDIQLFVDGELQSEAHQIVGTSDAAILPGESLYLVGGLQQFNGLIDELRVSSEAFGPDHFLKK